MEFKYKIDVATSEDTEALINFQLAMAKESEGMELVQCPIHIDLYLYERTC